jgi:Ca2+-transporting ATPase
MRTLGFGYAFQDLPQDADDILEVANDLVWLGFVAINDPIRPEVPPAVEVCNGAGIGVKIVTGDNTQTAIEIARQINLWKSGDIENVNQLTGKEFEALEDEAAVEAVGKLKVLSRARPVDKMRLVRLLQERGEVVAVTGDGTNDAPALNFANVGLAMGKTGTAVAKEASDIILLDDSFRSITNAVLWGRSLYKNIQKFVVFQLTINVAALGVALLGPFLGVEFPLTVIQMLWVNLIMDTFAALALATEPAEPAVMSQPPRKSTDFIVTGAMAREIFLVGAFFLAALVAILFFIQNPSSEAGLEVTTYELTYLFTVFVLFQFWNLFNVRMMGTNKSAFRALTQNNWLLIIAAIILFGQIIIVNFGGAFFRTVPLTLQDWLIILAGTSSILWIGEIRRLFARTGNKERAAA